MNLLRDIDSVYTNLKQFVIGYLFGYLLAILISIGILVAMLGGWSPIPKRISDQPKSELQDPFIFKDGRMYIKPQKESLDKSKN